MHTNKLFSRLIKSGTSLVILASMLMAAFLTNVTPALAAPRVGTVTVDAQSGTLTEGTPGSVTYLVTVTRGTQSTNNLTANLSISGLPAGATASFSPATLSWTGSNASQSAPRTSTLTVSTTAGAAAGVTNFTVTAVRTGGGNSGDNASGTGTLTIEAGVIQVTPTITFGTAPVPEFPGSNFTVNATTDSDGALTYSFVSGPCALVDANAGTFSPTGVGDCVVQADTAATASFLAGSAQQTVTITAPAGPSTPTITFGTAPAPEFPGSDFTVNATTDSDGALTYSFVSGPCALVDANAGTFSPTGVGDCVVQANTAATASFLAGSAQQTVTISAPMIHLYAVSGSAALPGQTVTVWGYNSTNASVTQPGGPTLVVNQGDTVTIALHNQIGESTALLFQGQDMIPDTTGVASGGVQIYAFTANRPGTYLYEAGLLPNAQHQVAMGLYGVLIVRPAAANQAYDSAETAFDDEAVLLLSDLDPALNNLANPAAFDMRNYAPKYFLINGQVYPSTTPIPTTAGNKVLLRYVNAGLQAYSMSLLGMNQVAVAMDGSPFTYGRTLVAETIAPGQTADMIASVPAAAVDGSKFALFDANLMLHNNKTNNSLTGGFGGMLTFLEVTGTSPVGDTTGPVTSNVAYAAGTLTATVDDSTTGGSNVTAAEYYLDWTGGTANPMSGAFGTPTVNVSASVTVPSGPHTLYVRGQDAAGNWGAFSSVLVNGGDSTGPATTGLTLTPGISNGSVSVAVHATGNDSATGGSNIVAAEYFIDFQGTDGNGASMTVNIVAPIASLDATITAGTINGLSEGVHTVLVHSQDAADNWGAFTTINLIVDKSGPDTSGVSAAPNPNNGTLGINSSTPAVRVTASFTDTASNISAGEGFIDTVGANGTGFIFLPSDGLWNNLTETGYVDIPLTTIAVLSEGTHTFYVHGKDAAGNWGPTSSAELVIDKSAPAIASITTLDANPTTAASVQFLVTFNEGVTGVTSTNFSLVQDGGLTGAAITSVTGSGNTRTVTVLTGSNGGTLGLNLTSAAGITDVAGNALPATGLPFVGQVYTVVAQEQLYFSTSGNTNPPGIGGLADDADIYFWNGSSYSRQFDASVTGFPGNANVDGFDRVDDTHFYMSFNGNVTIAIPGPDLSVADEDVVYYNNGTWSLFFDGSVNGLGAGGGGGFDLDAISIVGGTLYFSTDNNNNPPGAGGFGDDADIYRWNGGSSYTRVVDASTIGIPSSGGGNANVDGIAFVDATHFYLSFSGDTTISGFGTVQDEDVVYYNAGIWSVYFDGTAHGLTSGNLDIDAFDLP